MKTGVFLFGGVEMEDAGPDLPIPTDRRYSNEQMWKATEQIIDAACLSDKLGFDSFWLTEHHFQYEGYEVVPNGILLGAIIAERTEQIHIGMAFNIVPHGTHFDWPKILLPCTTFQVEEGFLELEEEQYPEKLKHSEVRSVVLTILIKLQQMISIENNLMKQWISSSSL